MIKNKKGGFTDMFLFIILSFIIVLVSGIFIYIGLTTSDKVHEQLDEKSTADVNYTLIIEQTIDKIPQAYYVLRWGSFILIVGMILSILFGSYLVTTRPIYFIPYLIVLMMVVMLSAVISNTYDTLLSDDTIGTVLQTFTMSNFILAYLPFVTTIIGSLGAIVMFASYKIGGTQ